MTTSQQDNTPDSIDNILHQFSNDVMKLYRNPNDPSIDLLKYKQALEALGYDKQVVENIKSVANATLPASWRDPVTGNKVFNQAFVEARETSAINRVYDNGEKLFYERIFKRGTLLSEDFVNDAVLIRVPKELMQEYANLKLESKQKGQG